MIVLLFLFAIASIASVAVADVVLSNGSVILHKNY